MDIYKNYQNKVHIIGHKNPDTDSICSAIAYAHLKNQISEAEHIPRSAGLLNELGIDGIEIEDNLGISEEDRKKRRHRAPRVSEEDLREEREAREHTKKMAVVDLSDVE